MKINIISCGIINNSNLKDIIQYYYKQFSLFKINVLEINCKNLTNENSNKKIWHATEKFNNSYNILLDEKGNQYNSIDFSKFIQSLTNYKYVNFLIGPNDGFNTTSKQKANCLLGLSKFTFPHKLAKLLLIEQLYRAESIINNSPYHKI